MLATSTSSRRSSILLGVMRETSSRSSTAATSMARCRSRMSSIFVRQRRRRARRARARRSVRIGASGLRSSCARIARNCPCADRSSASAALTRASSSFAASSRSRSRRSAALVVAPAVLEVALHALGGELLGALLQRDRTPRPSRAAPRGDRLEQEVDGAELVRAQHRGLVAIVRGHEDDRHVLRCVARPRMRRAGLVAVDARASGRRGGRARSLLEQPRERFFRRRRGDDACA